MDAAAAALVGALGASALAIGGNVWLQQVQLRHERQMRDRDLVRDRLVPIVEHVFGAGAQLSHASMLVARRKPTSSEAEIVERHSARNALLDACLNLARDGVIATMLQGTESPLRAKLRELSDAMRAASDALDGTADTPDGSTNALDVWVDGKAISPAARTAFEEAQKRVAKATADFTSAVFLITGATPL
jgi:hypothetical protein